MPNTLLRKQAEQRNQAAVDVAYLLANGAKPRHIRKSLKLSGRQYRKAKRAKATFSQPNA
jgi:hypothetical protein